ncbi:P2X purinoceptor 7-like isoform X2 [Hyperolius riggenbachi]
MKKLMEDYWSRFPPLDQDPSFYEKPRLATTKKMENRKLEKNDNNPEATVAFDWCKCGNCMQMPTLRESQCCNQIEAICQKFKEDITCVTQIPYFSNTFVNTEAVENFFRFHPNVTEHPDERLYNRKLRQTAYRAFTVWLYGYLGKRRKRAIPSCVVKRIRETFPDPEHLYKGFIFPPEYDASEMIDL